MALLVLAVGLLGAPAPSVADDAKRAKKLFRKANKHLKKKRFAKAIGAYEQAVALQPMVGAIHVNLARAYEKTGDCPRALLHFQAYLGLKPDAPDRDRINEERKGCVTQLGEMARLTVDLLIPEQPDEPEPPEGSEEEEEEEPEPPGLDVRLNGAPVGRAPLHGLILAPGEYTLEAFPDTGEVRSHKVRLVPAEGTEVVLGLDGEMAPGWLVFRVQPKGAKVQIDGEEVDAKALAERVRVGAGSHEIEVTDPTGRSKAWRGTVSVAAGDEETVEVTLEGGPGRVLFKVPEGAIAILDGEPVDSALPIEVRPGPHEVRVLVPGHQPWLRKVDVPPGETVELLPELVAAEKPALELNDARLTALGTAGVGVTAGIVGVIFGVLASSQFGEIEDRIAAGGAYASQDELDSIDGRQTVANVMFGVAAVGIGAGVALWLLEPDVSWLFGGGGGGSENPPATP